MNSKSSKSSSEEYMENNSGNNWRLFTSEDMNEGYQKLKRRRRRFSSNKENVFAEHTPQSGPLRSRASGPSAQGSALSDITNNIVQDRCSVKPRLRRNVKVPHHTPTGNSFNLTSPTSTPASTICNASSSGDQFIPPKKAMRRCHLESSRTLFPDEEVLETQDQSNDIYEPETNIVHGPWFTDDEDDSDYVICSLTLLLYFNGHVRRFHCFHISI
ncbi:hypothetical protein ACET3Z_021276 [Daucus carota]